MKKSDMKLFLNTEEEQDVKDSIRLLMKKTPLEINDFIESGGFGVRVDDVFENGTILFDVYRIVAMVEIKKKTFSRKWGVMSLMKWYNNLDNTEKYMFIVHTLITAFLLLMLIFNLIFELKWGRNHEERN